jgi:hypothetical protein
MRRLFVIFLLIVFPLQVSWAAVCAYCPGECVVEKVDGAKADDGTKAKSLMSDDADCSCCHLCAVGLMTMPAQTLASEAPQLAEPFLTSAFLVSIRPERPERPKWTRAA